MCKIIASVRRDYLKLKIIEVEFCIFFSCKIRFDILCCSYIFVSMSYVYIMRLLCRLIERILALENTFYYYNNSKAILSLFLIHSFFKGKSSSRINAMNWRSTSHY